MRISDWSSDVCSSDLKAYTLSGGTSHHLRVLPERRSGGTWMVRLFGALHQPKPSSSATTNSAPAPRRNVFTCACRCATSFLKRLMAPLDRCRSEEHTSELQSLMRISYDVFCLKQKKRNMKTNTAT